MPVKYIPDGYHTLTPYVITKGANDLIDFLKTSFDASEREVHRMPDGTVSHGELQIGNSIIMVAEASEKYPPMPAFFYLYVKDTDDLYKRAMAAGATSIGEPENMFYGDRNATVQDKSGNMWTLATHVEDVSQEEMQRRMEERMKQTT